MARQPRLVLLPGAALVGAALLLACSSATSAATAAPTGQIAFVRGSVAGQSAVYVVGVGGRGLRRITRRNTGYYEKPTWSPDGRRLILVRSTDGQRSFRLYIVDPSGRGLRALTPKRGLVASSPSWSPNGRWIAFTGSGGIFGECKGDLFLIRPDGTGLRRVLARASSPAWSPDGRRFAFVRGNAIHVASSSGRGVRRLVVGFHPDWSPDGRRLAFMREIGGRTRVFVVGATGRGVRLLTRARDFQLDPDWSPDGRWIAYYSTSYGGQEIYAAPVGGGAPRRITRPGTNAGDWDPDWRSG